eukprot:4853132-Prymnesium_polylepis.1
MVSTADAVEGEFHHVHTVADLADHFFKPGPVRDAVREALYSSINPALPPGFAPSVMATRQRNTTASHRPRLPPRLTLCRRSTRGGRS